MKKLIMIALSLLLIAGCSTDINRKLVISGVENPVISLDGTWRFTMDSSIALPVNILDTEQWSRVTVPGELAMQGFAIKHDQPCYYSRSIDIPSDYAGKNVRLKFHGVYSYSRVWVNGNFVREHRGGFTAWECDITDFIEPGTKALLTVELIDRGNDISYGSGYAKHQIGGILRSVELIAIPVENMENIYIETNLDKDYVNADLKISSYLNAGIGSVELELWNPLGKKTDLSQSRFELVKGDNNIEINIDNPIKWDSEHPMLYTLFVAHLDSENKLVAERKYLIGFREIELVGNKLLVNGDPVKLRGACRHDIHPLLGRTTTPEYDLKDVLLAKEANMNFLRTSHYPPSETFLEYCDKYGIYVEDETAVCFINSHRSAGYGEDEFSGTGEDNQYLSQVKEMLHYHRNHPSIIMWSVGNENVYNNNFKLSYDYIKKYDKSRPVIFSYPGAVPDSVICYDILSMHYPSYKGDLINQWGKTTRNFEYESMPVIYDEWAHVACYNKPTLQTDPGVRNFWGESLDKMWSAIYESEGGLGGAIWGYIDETFMLPDTLSGFDKWWGIMDEKILPSMYEGHCVGYGEWGIIDTWRRKKPEFWNTKKAYSPVKLLKTKVDIKPGNDQMKLPVYNRFNHTNLNELTMQWTMAGFELKENCIDLKPGEKGEILLPSVPYKTGDRIHLIFCKGDNILDEYDIIVGVAEFLPPEYKMENIHTTENENSYTIEGGNFRMLLNKNSGMIENVISGTDTLIRNGPKPRIIVPGDYVFYSTIVMKELADGWTLNNIKMSETEDLVNIEVQGKYGSLPVKYNYLVYGNGLIEIEYIISGIDFGTRIQEAGLELKTGLSFSKMSWERNGYWSYYPPGHPGAISSSIPLSGTSDTEYRTKPDCEWEEDLTDYYYRGINTPSKLSKSARSLRENIYAYSLITENGNTLIVFDNGKQGARFESTDYESRLFINSDWDYTSLLWGNYDRGTRISDVLSDKIIIKIN